MLVVDANTKITIQDMPIGTIERFERRKKYAQRPLGEAPDHTDDDASDATNRELLGY